MDLKEIKQICIKLLEQCEPNDDLFFEYNEICNPETILKMIEEIEKLREVAEAAIKRVDPYLNWGELGESVEAYKKWRETK